MDVKGFILFFIAVPLIVGGCSRTEPGNPEVPDLPQSYYVKGTFDAPLSISERGGIKSFEYYGSGMGIDEMFQYKFTKEDEGVRFTYDFYIKGEEAEGELMLDEAVMDEITELCEKHQVVKWDGFDEVDEYVLDGSGFSFCLGFEDKSYVSASGSNAFPDGYRDFNNDFRDFIGKISKDNGIEDALFPKVIESEDMEYLSVCFSDRGRADFDLMIRNDIPYEGIDTCYIRTQYDENKLFGDETVNHFSKKTGFDLKPFQEILKKYNIASWNGYDAYSEESDERFQLNVYYESGEKISAYGNVLPENYAEFKAEMIEAFETFYKAHTGDFYQ